MLKSKNNIDKILSAGGPKLNIKKLTALVDRLQYEGGGKVVDIRSFMKLRKPRIKKINLADAFELDKTVASLTNEEIEIVNDMLRRSLRKD